MLRYRSAVRWMTASVTVGAACAAAAVVSGLVGGQAGAGAGVAGAATTPAAAAGSIAPTLSSDYSIFRQAENAVGTTSETPAALASADGYQSVATLLTSSGDSANDTLGLDYAAALEVTAAGMHVWVIPGSGGMCAAVPTRDQGADEVCGTLAQIARHNGVLAGMLRNPTTGTVTVFGVAPDSLGTTATIHGQDIPVQDNVIVGTLSSANFPTNPGSPATVG